MEPKIIRVNIDAIKVSKDRVRKDLGDITSLALAMRVFGWLDYPVVDKDLNLRFFNRIIDQLKLR